MGIFDFFKKGTLDKDVGRVFHKMDNWLQGQQMVDQAISFRNLGQYDKAITILKETVGKYPIYVPAKIVLGNTLRIKGDIDGAEVLFKKILSEHATGDDYPLIEVYANLGVIYWLDRKDLKTSLKYYEIALNAKKPETIEDKKYELLRSDVYRDLCMIYFEAQNFELAKQYAFKRLQTIEHCPNASRVYGCCGYFEWLQKGSYF